VSYTWFDSEGKQVGSGDSLLLTEALVGKQLKLQAAYVDGHGTQESVTSALSAAVANLNDAPTGAVSFSGTLLQGEILRASHSLGDADGLGAVSYTWFDSEGKQVGSGDSLLLTEALVGKQLKVQASFRDGHGTQESVVSALSSAVANLNDTPTGAVSFSGTLQQGQILRASHSLGDADGLGAVSYSWFDTSGTQLGSGDSLLLTEALVGKQLKVQASYVDGHGTKESVVSALSSAIANLNDTPTGAVSFSGTLLQGQTLRASHSLGDADGLGAVSYTWFDAEGHSIGSGDSLLLTEALVGKQIQVQASYVDGHGTQESVPSEISASVGNLNDSPTGELKIIGYPCEGSQLWASQTLNDLDGRGELQYTWLDDLGSVLGHAETLCLTQFHVGKSIRLMVEYTDGHGSLESLLSVPTSAIQNQNNSPTGGVYLPGTAAPGQTVHLLSDLADLDGLGVVTYTWRDEQQNVLGNGDQLCLPADIGIGKTIYVTANYTDAYGQEEKSISASALIWQNPADYPEIRVNTRTDFYQFAPIVTALSDGAYLITWEGARAPRFCSDIYGQIYEADGQMRGTQLNLGSTNWANYMYAYSFDWRPEPFAISATDDGGFRMIWHKFNYDPSSLSEAKDEMFVQNFDAQGQVIGDLSNIAQGGSLTQPNIGRYDAQGNAVGGLLNINKYYCADSSLLALSNGSCLVTWTCMADDPNDWNMDIMAAIIASDNTIFKPSFRVSRIKNGDQLDPQVAKLADGDFLIVWQSNDYDIRTDKYAEGPRYGISAQRFTADGTQKGSEFLINTSIRNIQKRPAITALDDGGFVVTWEALVDQKHEIVSQRFASDNHRIGTEFVVAENNSLWLDSPSIAALKDGSYVVAWHGAGIYSERFGTPPENTLPSGSVSISGLPLAGHTLQAHNTLVDVDGLGSITYTWEDQQGHILGNGEYLTVDRALAGQRLHVTASYVDGHRYAEAVDSASIQIAPLPVSGVYSEFAVNTYTALEQSSPSISDLKDGGFVIVWQSYNEDGSFLGVYGQRYDANNCPDGSEFQINTTSSLEQSEASVTGLADGGFVVVWKSSADARSEWDVYGQIYSPDGSPRGGEFMVNENTLKSQSMPVITSLNNGNFVVSWTSNGQDGQAGGIYGRIYQPDGTASTSEFKINTTIASEQYDSSIAGLADGGFIATWGSYGQDGSEWAVIGQRYTAQGARVGTEFQANSYVAGGQFNPAVADLANGGFVITWMSEAQDGSGYGVYAQRYDDHGQRLDSEFRVNNLTAADQLFPQIAGLAEGGFVVTWTSFLQDGDGFGIYARRYSAEGQAIGSEFKVNTCTRLNQADGNVAGLADGGFVITWHSYDQDGSDYGIYAQRYAADGSKIAPAPSHEYLSLALHLALDPESLPSGLGAGELVLTGDLNGDGREDLVIGTFGGDGKGFHEAVSAVLGDATLQGLELLPIGRDLNAEQLLKLPEGTQLSFSSGHYLGTAGSGEIARQEESLVALDDGLALGLFQAGAGLSDLHPERDLDLGTLEPRSNEGVDGLMPLTLNLLEMV
ncbi:MAG: hypothetical protein RL095_4208, partial [Verrucomicrobiota bacterium]